MDKKGFTLIELLAVIVILAVIALIVTPIVTGIISEAKDSANARSVEGHIKNIEYQLIQKGFSEGNGTLSSGTYASFDDFGFTNYPTNDNVRCTNYIVSNGTVVSAEKCKDSSWTKDYAFAQGENAGLYKKYNAGDEILYNVNGSKCSDTNIEGCMRFYVINTKDTTKNENIEVILDHNTTAKTDYATALTQVGTDTASWTVAAQYDGSNGRLITADEVATIVGHNNNWNSSTATSSNYFYLDGSETLGWQTQVSDASNPSAYAWLYNNTRDCTTYGCTVPDSSTNGYWTSTLVSNDSTSAWSVYRGGDFKYRNVGDAGYHGVRPVITISKDAIK